MAFPAGKTPSYRFGKRPAVSEQDLEGLLAGIVFKSWSWDEWTDTRRREKQPVLLHRLCDLKTQLLDDYGLRSSQLNSINGAHFDFLAFVQNVLTLNLECGYIAPPPGFDPVFLSLKVCSDERKIRGNHNVAWFISFPEAAGDSQSPDHVHTFALAHMREKVLRNHPIWAEMQLDEGLLELIDKPLKIGDREFYLNVQYVADWKSLVYIMEFKSANTKEASGQICGWCHADKGFLRTGWRQTDIFKRWEMEPHRHQGRNLPSLTSGHFRYCSMHGCNRLLDNTVRIIQELAKKKQVADCMQSVCPNWGPKIATQCKHMKMFFQRQLHIHMANLFNDVNKNHQVRHSDGSRTVESTGQVVRMLLDGCRGFYHFAYLRKPADADYGALLLARNKLLAGYDAVEAELAPTTHYMTSHFIDFAEADGTAYHTLQEGAEHHHKLDRKDSRLMFTSNGGKHVHTAPLQQLLDIQEVRRILIRRGHQPPSGHH